MSGSPWVLEKYGNQWPKLGGKMDKIRGGAPDSLAGTRGIFSSLEIVTLVQAGAQMSSWISGDACFGRIENLGITPHYISTPAAHGAGSYPKEVRLVAIMIRGDAQVSDGGRRC